MKEEKANKGKPRKHHTLDEKVELVKLICGDYLDGNTIESCCVKNGITDRTFYNWLYENSEISELYKETRKKIEKQQKAELRQIALKSAYKLAGGFEVEEVTTEGRDIDGVFKAVKQTKVKKQILPNSSMVMYLLNNSNNFDDSEFLHVTHQKTDVTSGGEKINLPDWMLHAPTVKDEKE